jgi:L-alanine-DL-glutamate epimerase-like enolase superfamily enzyme
MDISGTYPTSNQSSSASAGAPGRHRGLHQNVALVKTTREAVGHNVDIMADAYMGWKLEYDAQHAGALQHA